MIGTLRRIWPFGARKTEGYRLSDPAGASVFGPPPGAKVPVTESSALNISAVWSAVRVITGAVAPLPLKVYRTEADDTRREEDAIPGAILAGNPNPEMTPVTFWETLVAHVLVWGNCYAEIERDGAGRPLALWPVSPNLICPRRNRSGELFYEGTAGGRVTEIPPSDMFHVPGLGFDGIRGYSVVEMARRSLGITATAEQAGEAFFADGMRPGGVLTFPGSLADLQKLNLEEGVQKKHGGAPRFGKALVLYGGLDYKALGIPPEDAQFLETREFQVEEVARWFNVPPHKLRDLRRATFSNIEHQGQEFVTDTLIYWLTKLTQEFKRKLLVIDGPGYYAEHTLDALLRGDTPSRYAAYGVGRQWGFLSPNDIRRMENKPPIPGGDVYHVPVNMVPLGSEPSRQPVPEPVPPPANYTAAKCIAVSIANELADYDAENLVQKAGDVAGWDNWLEHQSRPGSWDWTADVIRHRCRGISLLLGRTVDPLGVAAVIESQRRPDLESLYGLRVDEVAGQVTAIAAKWRATVGEMATLIVGSDPQ